MDRTPDLHTLLAATAYLMTRHSLQQRQGRDAAQTAEAVKQHLEMLLCHPDILASTTACNSYQALLWEWGKIAAHHRQQAYKPLCTSLDFATHNPTRH